MENLLNILIIDDDEISNFLTARIINELNISKRVEVAKNGYQGLQTILKKCASSFLIAPNLILLDTNMPVMDGMEFMQAFDKLHFVNRQKNIIALMSNHMSLPDKIAYENLGIREFIPKPITKEIITELCAKYELVSVH